MALEREDLVVVQNLSESGRLMKCTVSSLFTESAELEGIDGGTVQLSAGEYDYIADGDENCATCVSIPFLPHLDEAPMADIGDPCNIGKVAVVVQDLDPLP